MSVYLDLAARCEAATGGNDGLGSLNADALRGLGWRSADGDVIDPSGNLVYQVPFLVGSLDAALTLVPEGAGLTISRYWSLTGDGAVWSAEIATGGVPSNPRQVFDCYDAASAALAVVASSLRARDAASTGEAL